MAQTKPPVPAFADISTAYRDSCQAVNFCSDELRRICGNTDVNFITEERDVRLKQVKDLADQAMNNIIRINNNGGKTVKDKVEELELTPFPIP